MHGFFVVVVVILGSKLRYLLFACLYGLCYRVSDLDLEKDETLKLASLGNQANSQATVDNLILSLASHKK